MRYWDPRRAAAHRITKDVLTKYGPKMVGQLVDNLGPDKPSEEAITALESFWANEQWDPSLLMILRTLRDSNLGMFRLVMSELSTYRAKQGPAPQR